MDKLLMISIFLFLSVLHITPAVSSPSFKVTRFVTNYLNGHYIGQNRFKTDVIDVNSTTSRITLTMDVLTEFPKDVSLKTRIIRYSNSNDHKGTSLGVFETHICDLRDPLRAYLPNFFITVTAAGNCIQQGHYTSDNAGQFKFYDLLPPEELRGTYLIRSLNTIEAPGAFIQRLEIESHPV